MNDRPPVVSEMFELNYLLLTQICFKLDCHLCLWKSIIAQSVPLLYSAMKHSTTTKAQKDISKVFKNTFQLIAVSRYFSLIFIGVNRKQLYSAMEPCHSY